MKGFNFVVFVFFAFMAGTCAAQYDSDMDIFPQSIATINDVSAAYVNPAGLAPEYVLGFSYMHSYSDSTFKGDDGFIFGMNGVAVSVEWLKHSTNIFRRKYLLAGGSRMFPNFYWGISYSWFSASNLAYRHRSIWKTGIIYRPIHIMSLGMVVDDVNTPKFGSVKMNRKYTVGAGIRPLGKTLTLSVDAITREKESLKDIKSSYRIEVTPRTGFNLVAAYRSDGFVSAGLAYSFGESQIGTSSNLHEGHFRGGSLYFNQGATTTTETSGPTRKIGEIKIDETLVEEVRGHSLFGPSEHSLLSVLNNIKAASTDRSIAGLYLKIEKSHLGFAGAQELRAAINDFKKSGKNVVAFLEEAGNGEYYIASAANEIYLSPTGYLELKGLSAEITYLKGTLDKIGVQADFIGIGQYKTAPEMFTKVTISEAESVQMNALLDDLFNQMITDISASRGFSESDFRALVDAGPCSPKVAFKKGLVTGLANDDEITENSEKYFGKKYSFTHLKNSQEVIHHSDYWGDPAKIAVVYATGEITGKYNRDRIFIGRTMGENTLSQALRAARTDREIKAVVLRVDSPGGELEATDGIYRELEKIKSKKPLIISVGNVGASGGYYLSCIGDDIYMMPGTITGSIGIFTGKYVAHDLYEKIGVNKVILKRGRHADIRSDWRALDDEERQLVYTDLKEFYYDFVDKVARWRKLEPAQVDSIGQGRVWSGKRAIAIGLGTNEGGLLDAIEQAKSKASICEGQPIKLVIYPQYKFDLFGNFNPFDSGLSSAIAEKISDVGLLNSLGESNYYYRLPYNIQIK